MPDDLTRDEVWAAVDAYVEHLLEAAGNPSLMTTELKATTKVTKSATAPARTARPSQPRRMGRNSNGPLLRTALNNLNPQM